MVAWYWILAAGFGGAIIGVMAMCILAMASRGEDFKDGLNGNRPSGMVDLDPERRVIALSMTRAK